MDSSCNLQKLGGEFGWKSLSVMVDPREVFGKGDWRIRLVLERRKNEYHTRVSSSSLRVLGGSEVLSIARARHRAG